MQQVIQLVDMLRGKDKARPTRDELVKVIDQILWDCKCDVDGHTIRIKVNGYIYSIPK